MQRPRLSIILPGWRNAGLAVFSAVLLILAFPDFEWWFLAWFALVPLMFAVERERASTVRSFVLGWIFGTLFFYGTCWWLTFAPINYAAFPPLLAYSLFTIVAAVAGLFPAIFAAILSVLLRRFGTWAFLAAPFVWVFTEFLRYWLTGNNWNAIGYSQAFGVLGNRIAPFDGFWLGDLAAYGGVSLVGFACLVVSGAILALFFRKDNRRLILGFSILILILVTVLIVGDLIQMAASSYGKPAITNVVAIQPNVPMSGLDYQKWGQLRARQIELAKVEISKLPVRRISADRQILERERPTVVILPESPMNFMYEEDREFQTYINDFARRNNVSVLFNSAEPDKETTKYFNSAVMIDAQGRKTAEYDKIYLLPFGEAVPVPLESFVPAFVGSFSYGKNYDLLPVGDAKAGVMICFESHFGQLSRRFVADGADVIIEMTNDGYLGLTPVLRQHLANAVFRAVETNRPVLRVTNVGITAYIDERGNVMDPTASYTEDVRIWPVSKSGGTQTFYVRFGDWFAWLCSAVTLALLAFCVRRRRAETRV